MNLEKIYIKINDLNNKLIQACEDGNEIKVREIVFEGANDLNSGLRVACINGHIEIVKYLISKGGDLLKCINCGYDYHPDIIKLVTELIISKSFNTVYLNNAFIFICGFGDINLVKSMFDNKIKDFVDQGLINAYRHKNKDIVEFLIDYGNFSHKYDTENIENIENMYKYTKYNKLLLFTKLNENIIDIVVSKFKLSPIKLLPIKNKYVFYRH